MCVTSCESTTDGGTVIQEVSHQWIPGLMMKETQL